MTFVHHSGNICPKTVQPKLRFITLAPGLADALDPHHHQLETRVRLRVLQDRPRYDIVGVKVIVIISWGKTRIPCTRYAAAAAKIRGMVSP
jgi:hypothetical protein